MYDIIIIGAGPAGLTAAIYARRASKTVLVLEANVYGGQIVNTPDIENYPVADHISGFDFAMKIYSQASGLGAEIKLEKALEIKNGEIKTVKTPRGEYQAKAVIIATGSQNRKLGVEGEDKLIGRGISYCATCDGAFFKNKKVAVVGGGNTALEDALYLADVAETVYLIHRRDSFRAEASTVEKLKEKPNVSGLFVAVGRIPESEAFNTLADTDSAGYFASSEDCKTKTDGIFVAGDVRSKEVRQLVTATADGAVAATEAVKYLNS